MKRGIWLSVGAVVLVGVLVFVLWYIRERGAMRAGSKDAFIPYNSALVVTVNARPQLSPELSAGLGKQVGAFRERLLARVTDTLRATGRVASYPYVLAVRVEGKNDVVFLYAMDCAEVLARGELNDFLLHAFGGGKGQARSYDRYKIYTLGEGKEAVYFSVCGSIVLVSDSDLYIEDGLKQFDAEEAGGGVDTRFKNIDKYFSAGAGMHLFMNTELFAELLPLYMQTGKFFPGADVSRFFKWGALDGEFSPEGFALNGFMHYGGQEQSYVRTLSGQQAREVSIDRVVPARAEALGVLQLSDPAAYFSALDAYRYDAGRKNAVHARKQQYVRMFGKDREQELRNLLQGEFAGVQLGFNAASGERDGIIVAALKSGSLAKELLQGMVERYARFDGKEVAAYARRYRMDEGKAFAYYRCPVEDLPAVYWGEVFGCLKSRYVLVVDNYWVFATSERAVEQFIKDYVHGHSIRDAEWYGHLKKQLAGKHNAAYFARTGKVIPLYKSLAKGSWKEFLAGREEEQPLFPSFAMQWSNEGELLYSTLFLGTRQVEEAAGARVLWQTKLEAKVSMKPVPVVNHNTGAREIFVQDDAHSVYLVNDVGRVLWKQPLEERINSEVYQVDLYKNGKLQYLFSTPSRIYLIDRNGEPAGAFPLTLKARCEQGISVCDYDGTKDYRIFAPCDDHRVYLYGLDGRPVKGWKPDKTDAPVVARVQHFRVEGKDYLVFADRYRLYILDRKGKVRVKVSSVFDLPAATDIYLVRKNGRPQLLFAGAGGKVHLVDFSGKTGGFALEGVADGFRLNVADVDRNGQEECIVTSGNRLLVCDLDGKLLADKTIEAESLDYPYVYRFSASDLRIGLTDSRRGQMLLLDTKGGMSQGFPIAGDSPCSIVFAGSDGFYLFAGVEDGSLIKYRVER